MEQASILRRKHLRTPVGHPVHAAGLNGHASALDADIEGIDGQIQDLRAQPRNRDTRSAEPFADEVMHPWRLPPTMHAEVLRHTAGQHPVAGAVSEVVGGRTRRRHRCTDRHCQLS
jgi:hypothetical protein